MPNNQSWEFYQQSETGTGIPYPLYWLCGLAGNGSTERFTHPLEACLLVNNTLYAVLFDQMKSMTVSKMFIAARLIPPVAGASVRLGIYENVNSTAATINAPGARLFDAGPVAFGDTAGIKEIPGLNGILARDTRYWAALLTNGSVGPDADPGPSTNITISAIGGGGCPAIFWGAKTSTTFPFIFPATGVTVSGVTSFSALPNPFPALNASNVATARMPCIGLAFSGGGSASGRMSMAARLSKVLDRPIPVALQMRLDSAVSGGTSPNASSLNQAILLQHSGDASHPFAWYSQPLDLGAGVYAAWKLERTDNRTWTLLLQTIGCALVTYQAASLVEREAALPIRLQLVGVNGKHFENWPRTITVSPG